MKHAFLLALLAVAASAGEFPHDVLVSILREPYPNQQDCSLNHLNYTSGSNVSLARLDVCAQRSDNQSVGQNVMAYFDSQAQILYTTGSGDIWGVDPYTGSTRLAASVPAGLGIVGLAFVNGTLYALANDGLYSAPVSAHSAGNLTKAGSFIIDAPSATAFSPSLFFAATQTHIVVVSLLTGNVVKRTKFGFTVIDLDYDPAGDQLIVLYNYGLYTVDYNTAKSSEIITIPDGDGYPGTSFFDAKAQFYFFADFDNAYSIELSGTAAIRSRVTYNGYFCEGGHFFPLPPRA